MLVTMNHISGLLVASFGNDLVSKLQEEGEKRIKIPFRSSTIHFIELLNQNSRAYHQDLNECRDMKMVLQWYFFQLFWYPLVLKGADIPTYKRHSKVLVVQVVENTQEKIKK